MKELTEDLLTALKDALMWIDAVPQDTPLPAMPGFDRDEVDALIDESMRLLDKPVIAIYRCDQCAHLYHAEVPHCHCSPDEMTITAMQVVALRDPVTD
ncbi:MULTISPECIES: hypothetical protein [Gammaproteobacteria]|jgi:hypothetical protein|uniref:hypothetical protein n=1 Tax=Gammaproteobacteria TaxID=1236 RepID=UPI001CC61BEB|nr:hypothetical protein [Aeromonas caviae]GJA77606.1 hypothetical protein KAM354_28420 [Aeromonas caviae]HDT5889322.1 hypothetical protein [Aeromonas dhakensis]HEB4980363.1 hypothetical protein [Aeromonas dhakensis]